MKLTAQEKLLFDKIFLYGLQTIKATMSREDKATLKTLRVKLGKLF